MTYAVRRQVLSADGATTWTATCPPGAVPVAGGTLAGFHSSGQISLHGGWSWLEPLIG